MFSKCSTLQLRTEFLLNLERNKEKCNSKHVYIYLSLDAAAMADVTLLNEGTQIPGKIYSFINSELFLYSS